MGCLVLVVVIVVGWFVLGFFAGLVVRGFHWGAG